MSKATLTSLSTTELLTLAAERGIAKAARMTREDLITALQVAAPIAAAAPAPSSAAPAGSSGGAPASRPHPGPDTGLPIPDRYGHDRLVLLVQDPQHVFAYWEITAELLDRVQHEAGDGATPVLVLVTAHGNEQREIDLRGGNYYLSVAPQATYRAQLALRDRRGTLHPLAMSNSVTTPAAVAAPTRAAGDEAWMAVDETFHELLSLAGLPGAVRDSSMSRLGITESRLTAVAWKETLVPAPSAAALAGKEGPVKPLSSATLVTAGRGPEMEEFMSKLLSSYNLSSHSLGSHSLSSTALVEI
jgi:hypothetical protein